MLKRPMLTIGGIGMGIPDSIPDSGPLLTARFLQKHEIEFAIQDSDSLFLPESELGIATATHKIYTSLPFSTLLC